MNVFTDLWHEAVVDENGLTLKHPFGCPTHPNGPAEFDTEYGCLTYVVISYQGRRYEEVHGLAEGRYMIRYWHQQEPDGLAEGFEVVRQ
jgi:hypothetical protein